ncbi:MAG: class I tRNA ligase family protein, partial [Alphaproteobacteria bacterium]
QTRYFLLREVPFGNDGDFSHRSMVARMNNELANDYGNLAQRVLSMVAKNCDAALPENTAPHADDGALLDQVYGLLDTVRAAVDRQAFHEALEAIWVVVRAANVYVDRQAPWVLRKQDPTRMASVLYTLSEAIRCLGLLTRPFMPEASDKILDLLAVDPEARSYAAFGAAGALQPGAALPKPTPVFPRFDDSAGN